MMYNPIIVTNYYKPYNTILINLDLVNSMIFEKDRTMIIFNNHNHVVRELSEFFIKKELVQ